MIDMERHRLLHDEKESARDSVLEIEDKNEEKKGAVMIEKHMTGGQDKMRRAKTRV